MVSLDICTYLDNIETTRITFIFSSRPVEFEIVDRSLTSKVIVNITYKAHETTKLVIYDRSAEPHWI